jgi:hypothetical protein
MERAEEPDLFRRHVLTATNLEQDITLLYYTGNPSFTALIVQKTELEYYGSACFWASRIRNRIHLSEICIRLQIRLKSRGGHHSPLLYRNPLLHHSLSYKKQCVGDQDPCFRAFRIRNRIH